MPTGVISSQTTSSASLAGSHVALSSSRPISLEHSAKHSPLEAVVEARRREIEAGVEIANEQIGETARRYAAVALEALAVTAVYGEGMARVQAAREILDRAYGKVPEAAAEPLPTVVEGWASNPFANRTGTGQPNQ